MADFTMPEAETWKRAAAERALQEVEPGMRLGLGTGSTARHFVILLGERVRDGLDVVGVPTSEQTHRLAVDHGVPLTTLDDMPELDLTVDGADEIDPKLRLIKGGGAALLREKIVAAASRRVVIIADESKLVDRLGRFPLPIEVAPFGLTATRRAVERAIMASGAHGAVRLRLDSGGAPLLTDGGHHILDASLGEIGEPDKLAAELGAIPGVMEHGLFIGLADRAIVAGAAGVRVIDRA